MKDKSPYTFGVIRYLRRTKRHSPSKGLPEAVTWDNLGGVVFAINILHADKQLQVAWAICRDNDNFSKEFGRTQALKRLADLQYIVLAYDASKDLLANIVGPVVKKEVIVSLVTDEQFHTLQEACG